MDISNIKGIGPKKKEILNKKKIYDCMDLLHHLPKKYINVGRGENPNLLKNNETGQFVCQLKAQPVAKRAKKYLITRAHVEIQGGHFFLIFFNQPYALSKYHVGDFFWIEGKIQRKGLVTEIYPRSIEPVSMDGEEKIQPIYPQIYQIKTMEIRNWIKKALSLYEEKEEMLPLEIMNKLKLMKQAEAYREIHFPSSPKEFEKAKQTLIFRELFLFQCGLLMIKHQYYEKKEGLSFDTAPSLAGQKMLPYTLTSAQQRVLSQINEDMASSHRMHRLIQGDVGSGKTILAFLSMLNVRSASCQSVLMAPTEILATQHFEGFVSLFPKYEKEAVLLTGSVNKAEKEKIKEGLQKGRYYFIFGTHALLEEDVVFSHLGLTITDEQHRFGVLQRQRLNEKDRLAHVLVMSATPIPRTLGLILYGDLDISIIDELPQGRKPVVTKIIGPKEKKNLYGWMAEFIEKKSQCYYVCPKIAEDEDETMANLERVYQRLSQAFSAKKYTIKMLHGKMKGPEKKAVMAEFSQGKIHILLSTTVIEVGVNVPNANMMVIENAERFGLAQIHQLRGRIGRGGDKAYCFLCSEKTENERMKVLEKSRDGFFIAEEDLKLRGPGYFFGVKQHGVPVFRFASLYDNGKTLEIARKVATAWIKKDPLLSGDENEQLRMALKDYFHRIEEIDFIL